MKEVKVVTPIRMAPSERRLFAAAARRAGLTVSEGVRQAMKEWRLRQGRLFRMSLNKGDV